MRARPIKKVDINKKLVCDYCGEFIEKTLMEYVEHDSDGDVIEEHEACSSECLVHLIKESYYYDEWEIVYYDNQNSKVTNMVAEATKQIQNLKIEENTLIDRNIEVYYFKKGFEPVWMVTINGNINSSNVYNKETGVINRVTSILKSRYMGY